MKNYTTQIEHFENGITIFNTTNEFINFVQDLWIENCELENGDLKQVQTYEEALFYLQFYCDNFKLKYTNFLFQN